MDNKEVITIALTGATGAMGGEVLSSLLSSTNNYKIRLLVYDKEKKPRHFFRFLLRKGGSRIYVIRGDLSDYSTCRKFIEGADYVVHCGAVIPPKSDHNSENTINTNYIGTKNIVDAIKESGNSDKIKLVHISTVAVYGNRNHKHPWARMGDPVMSSPYDYYSAAKIKGERYVLESGLKNWVVLRQSAMYHKYFLINNLFDGLMFHTCWNAPLEWITDKDSGRCIKNLIDKDLQGLLEGFWRQDYNIGGGEGGRETGYETFNSGFSLMGASAKKFFRPYWNIPRNFHGVWYTDSWILDKWLDYRRESSADYWKRMKKSLWYYSLGRLVPSALIRRLAIERLLTNSNAPQNWIRLGKKGRIDAFFGGSTNYNKLPRTWEEFPLLAEGKAPKDKYYLTSEYEEIDYNDLKDEKKAARYKLNHGYDDDKKDADIDIEDAKKAAAYRGGKVLSHKMKTGDLYSPLEWECHNKHKFLATPFTVLKAGFWCPECCEPLPNWNYDALAPHIPFYAQVWYDTHSPEEVNNLYPYDKDEDNDMIKSVREL